MVPPFNWFDPKKAVRIYRGNLPHWRQDGCLYFITFRLVDSIPRAVAAQWQEERRIWLEAHRIDGYPDRTDWHKLFNQLPQKEQKVFERINARRLFVELDRCHGECLLQNSSAQKAMSDALLHFDNQRWRIGDFVLMPNHVHALAQPLSNCSLEKTIYSVKRFAAREINRHLGRTGRVWQKEYYDHIVRSRNELKAVREYIANNPAKAHLPDSAVTAWRAEWLDAALT
jgi:type I restriction enzyme R subunit